MNTRIIGFILLFLGVALILYGVYSSFNIFNSKTTVPQIFTPAQIQKVQINGNDLQTQLQGMIPLASLMGDLAKFFNLATWSIFMGILIFAGAQISSLGIKLIK